MSARFDFSECNAVPASPDGAGAAGGLAPSALDRAIDCFTPGTLITTRAGKRPVERLTPGDMLLTRDRGFQPLLFRGLRNTDGTRPIPAGALVTIRAGALGPGQPERDMTVSPGHRLLCTDCALLAGTKEPEALIEARALVGRPGIVGIVAARAVFVHLLMENHEVILAENAWTESFRLSRSVVRTIAEARCALTDRILPGLRAHARAMVQAPARLCLAPGGLAA